MKTEIPPDHKLHLSFFGAQPVLAAAASVYLSIIDTFLDTSTGNTWPQKPPISELGKAIDFRRRDRKKIEP